jgi:hypothetical protein
MYVFVVSTDIVSSSELWLSNNGEWMRDRILFHNAIIQNWADAHEFNILPSSPEGDAFILWKITVTDDYFDEVKQLQAQFKYHLDKTGELAVHSEFMTDGDKLTDKNTVTGGTKLALGKFGIYIRVGVAYSKYGQGARPLERLWEKVMYKHAAHLGDSCINDSLYTYRGKLITNSEDLEMISPAGGLAVAQVTMNSPKRVKIPDTRVPRDEIFEYKRRGHEYDWAVRNRKRFAKTSLLSYVNRESEAVVFIKARTVIPWPTSPSPRGFSGELLKTKRGKTQILTFQADKKKKGHIKKCESAIFNAIKYMDACVKADADITYKRFNVGISAGHVRIRYAPLITLDASCWIKDIFGDVVNIAARAAGAGLDTGGSEYKGMDATLGTIYAEHTISVSGSVPGVQGDIQKRRLRDLFSSNGQFNLHSHITVGTHDDIERKAIHAGEGGALAKFTIIIKSRS